MFYFTVYNASPDFVHRIAVTPVAVRVVYLGNDNVERTATIFISSGSGYDTVGGPRLGSHNLVSSRPNFKLWSNRQMRGMYLVLVVLFVPPPCSTRQGYKTLCWEAGNFP